MSHRSWKTIPEEKGYPWLFFYVTKAWLLGLLVTLIVVAIAGGFYLWYSQFGNDVAPDSTIGLIFASAGTLCFILAAILYLRHRRSQRRKAGQLNASLHWHIFLAIMSLALIFMHSFGNFNARTGTYALYGLVALVISGFIGRLMDRIMPRLIASEVAKTVILQHIWRPSTPSGQTITKQVERATQRQEFYRSVIRYWRVFHVVLALLTLGLVIWHLVFVVQLLVFHMG
ncbi:MAG TPA: hypothetical protein VKU38_20750 [Ktedonobacteraceae bacterium]|nr:hypothetical protein [Ktedonobacteraceae bacterium]